MDLFQAADTRKAAEAARDAGMALAVNNAEANCPGWTTTALNWICEYAKTHSTFISEDCTEAAMAAGVPAPTNPKAWGAPFQMAARRGVIRRDGFGVSKRRHLSPTPLWKAVRG